MGRDEHIEKALIGREFTTADAERDLSHAVLSDDQLDGVLREHFGLHMSNSDVEALLARLT